MPDPLVRLDVAAGRATVTLDSPANRNALSRRLLADLVEALQAAAADPSVRVVVLTGSGTVFCSGADLKEAREGGRVGVGGLPEILRLIMEGDRPVVARVNGAARAGGVGLLAACDVAVALASASFAFSEVRIGVAPAVIAVPCLRRMPRQAARLLMLTGRTFGASEAVEAGLLDITAPDDGLDAAVDEVVSALLLGAPEALAHTRRLVDAMTGSDPASLGRDFDRMKELSAERFGSDEAAEGIRALIERRPPAWVPAAG